MRACIDERRRALLDAYEIGIERYRARAWAEAERAFRRALAIHPDDGPSGVYLERLAALAAGPPPADWDGVYVARAK